MALSLDALRRCVSASPIWRAAHPESAHILTATHGHGSPASAAASIAAPAMAAAKSRRSCSMNRRGGTTTCRLWERVQIGSQQDYEKINSANHNYSAFGAPALRRWRLLLKKLQSRFNSWMRTRSACVAGPQERNLNIDLLYDPISYALNFDDGCYRAPSHVVSTPSLIHSKSLSSLL
ncbi:hypothetical protein GOP47_0025084 [Adiantum capillus-veneris]|uniref:Uncharacterized protein n=1 Tax=Adiantum capillus-veneris TaxID=13818 RepID=A0A9D4U2Z9_ADICA|nr:hypothetical protein GOP47_0025084 [Adiantum capillus-veneris]